MLERALSLERLVRELPKYCFYHCIDLGEGVVTPGNPDLKLIQAPVSRAIAELDLSNKRVLDVGCCDGLFCIQAERQGALDVLGIDNSLSRGAVELVLPWLNSKVQMKEMNFYNLPTTYNFDLIIFAGVLYHLRMPFFAFRKLAELTNAGGTVIIETALYLNTPDSMLYCPKPSESPYEATSVTFFSHAGLVAALESMGFEETRCHSIIVEAPGIPTFSSWDDFSESDIYRAARTTSKPLIGRGTYVSRRSAKSDDSLLSTYWYGEHRMNKADGADDRAAVRA